MRKGCLVVAVVVAAIAGIFVLTFRDDLTKLDLRQVPRRAAWQLPERVIAALQLAPGAQVADLGSGDGYFTFFLAEAVGPSGRVYAVDVDRTALDAVVRGAEQRGLTNVVAVEASRDDPRLPDGEIDLVFICNVYHHLDDQPAYFRRLHRALNGDGRVAIVEPKEHGLARYVNPPGHATPRSRMQAEMTSAGFRPVTHFDWLPVQDFEIYARSGDR